ncbi:MAG: hypothetical protein K2X03_14385 [Bryobacteraceae bacterium]|nr:hypothetical protein [Bryobacteraceae bacterium]
MVENVVMALVTGLVIPIAKEVWDDRKGKAKQAVADGAATSAVAPVMAHPSPVHESGGGWGKAIFRLVVAGALGLIAAVVVLSLVDAPSLDSDEFELSEAALSVICVGVVWFVLDKVGPLRSRG